MASEAQGENGRLAAETMAYSASASRSMASGEPTSDIPVSDSVPRTTGLTALPQVSSQGDLPTFKRRNELRYQMDSLLGRGGMGEVQLARDHDIGRRVAVKRLLDEKNPRALARFIDEVRTVGNLEHPNIVPIHDVGVDANGAFFFVMKYVEGETLASIISKLASGDEAYHRRFQFEARLDLFTGLLRALQYAHGQGLIHRDVKPENIMVGQFGEVMLMDWGIARRGRDQEPQSESLQVERAASETLDGTIIGTPRYMSPEQAAGEINQLDARSDLYSAFVVLFELLTTRPYLEPTSSTAQSLAAARDRQPPKLGEPAYDNPHQGAVPGELRHFLRRGLASKKEERFADADSVLQELAKIRSGDCAVQCPLTFIKAISNRYDRFLDRHPPLALMGAFVAIAACASGLFNWGMWLFQVTD